MMMVLAEGMSRPLSMMVAQKQVEALLVEVAHHQFQFASASGCHAHARLGQQLRQPRLHVVDGLDLVARSTTWPPRFSSRSTASRISRRSSATRRS
jgi:hypothetical protein